MNSNRRERRHRFDYLYDNDQIFSRDQRISIRQEPLFKIKKTIDPSAKQFYRNDFNGIDSNLKKIKEKHTRQTKSLPKKSIEKKKTKNDVEYLSQLTAKFNSSAPSTYSLYLADRNPSTSSHLQYYIKPYRGDKPLPSINKTKSISFSSQTNQKKKNRSISNEKYSNTIRIYPKEDEIFEEYEILFEEIKENDRKLQSLSLNPSTYSHLKINEKSSLKTLDEDNLVLSPMTIQISLVILIIFNLITFYFFNEINLWWQENIQQNQRDF